MAGRSERGRGSVAAVDGPRGREGGGFGEAAVFAALVEVDGGRPGGEAVHVTPLAARAGFRWPCRPFLCQASENRAVLLFHEEGGMWYCDIEGGVLTLRKGAARVPQWRGFDTIPLCLPGGKLLILGSGPDAAGIFLLSCGERPGCERVGSVPGEAGRYASSVLVGGRFVLGFSGPEGHALDNFWMFDLQTRRGSRLRREGEWHPPGYWVRLVVLGDTLYLLGPTTSCISLAAVSSLVVDGALRFLFCGCLGLPLTPPPRFTGRVFDGYAPVVL